MLTRPPPPDLLTAAKKMGPAGCTRPAPKCQVPQPNTLKYSSKICPPYAQPAAPVADVATLTPTAQAAALGFPATLFGFTPADRAYWHEPGLPWLTARQMRFLDEMPLDYRGHAALLSVGYLESDHMAPRFPRGCAVQTAPVFERQQLVVGRVYTYRYRDGETGEWAYQMARLVKIGGNYLEVKADNNPVPAIWLLREPEHEATWDMREVTHYVSYPAEQEGGTRE